MNQKKFIQSIREIAVESRPPFLDIPILDYHQWCCSSEGQFFMANGAISNRILDVPVVSIRGVNRSCLVQHNVTTWHDLLFNIVNGNDWSNDYLQHETYWTNPVHSAKFPADNARGPLKFSKVGQMYFVSNGNHRLVAGMIYLWSRYKNDANILQAECSETSPDTNVVEKTREIIAYALQHKIPHSFSYQSVIRSISRKPTTERWVRFTIGTRYVYLPFSKITDLKKTHPSALFDISGCWEFHKKSTLSRLLFLTFKFFGIELQLMEGHNQLDWFDISLESLEQIAN